MKLLNYLDPNLIDKNKKYILGFSGGPDSTFLFFNLLNIIKKENIIVCHVNYNLRNNSIEAQHLVENYCAKNNVVCKILSVSKTEKVGNIESWARKIRYGFFIKTLKENNFDEILIAHNENDLVETFLLQKQRNNLVSYYGLRQKTKFESINIVRPMLNIKKSEIVSWLDYNKIKYNIDYTNFDEKYLRNKIRNKIKESDFDSIIKECTSRNKLMERIYQKIENKIVEHFNLNFFITLNEKEQQVFLFEFLKKNVFDWNIGNLKKHIFGEIIKQLSSRKSFIKIEINNSFCLIKDRKNVFVCSKNIFDKKYIIRDKNDLCKIEHFLNYEEIKRYYFLNKISLVVRNDFLTYQNKLFYRSKLIKMFFSRRKTSYFWKIYNGIYSKINDNKVLNKLS